MKEENCARAGEIATDIIGVSRNTLLLNLRFMDSAVFRLPPVLSDTTISTDGNFLYYGASYVLKRYKQEPSRVVRDILHVVLHCVFRHSFVKPPIDTDIWDLATDIAVENIINSLDLQCLNSKCIFSQADVIEGLKSEIKSLNAEKIYRYYKDKELSKEQLTQIRLAFVADDHSCWYNFDNGEPGDGNGQGESDKSQNGQNDYDSGNVSDLTEKQNKTDCSARDALEKEWSDVSKHISMDIEAFSKKQGIKSGDLSQQLLEINREKYDYAGFLGKFAVMGEEMKVNDEEFDYVFYTLGLNIYGNIPLIEPLEYKEVKRIREFVIAIDTSGSTSGETVRHFLEKTYNILKSSESFFSKINLHIIQCDSEIQEHIKITEQREFDSYIESISIKGLGGTDFRPVFTEVDRMVKNKEFSNLKGIIYFTDGYGTFPSKKPDYETAFVFLRNEYDNPSVPPWAIKLILNDEEI